MGPSRQRPAKTPGIPHVSRRQGFPTPFSRKRFGQHFLEPQWADKVLRAIAPAADQTFLEIGPGRGALTRSLAARAERIVAFEVDRDLASALRATAPPNLAVEEGDFLDVTPDRLRRLLVQIHVTSRAIRVAGNLPYNVASPILFKLVELYAAGAPLIDATLMLQREVAQRLIAPPGTRDYGVLPVLIGYRATAEPVLALPPGAFRPAPKVHSSLVRLRFHPPVSPAADETVFAEMVQALFTRRRKTTANALLAFAGTRLRSPADALARAALDGARRPETLSIAELVSLADVFTSESR